MRLFFYAMAITIMAIGCGSSAGGKNDSGAVRADTAALGADVVIAATDAVPDPTGTPDAGCASFAPCGGSLVGTWKIESGCSDVSTTASTSSPCQPFPITDGPAFTGTFGFASVGSYSATMTITVSSTGTYSAACLTQMRLTCPDLIASLSQPDAASSGTCTSGPAGDCTCSFTHHGTFPDQGTYATNGSAVVMTSQGSSASTSWDYCVQGDTLLLHRGLSDASSPSEPPISLIVARRQ